MLQLTKFVALWVMGMSVALAEPQAFAMPEGAQWLDVGTGMRINGRRIEIKQFEAHQPIAEVLKFYRVSFGNAHVEPPLEGHQLIARRIGDDFITVRLTALDADHTMGLIAKTHIEAPQPRPHDALLLSLPSDTKVMSDVESDDLGKTSRMLVYQNERSAQSNVERLRELLRDRGMTEQRDKVVVDAQGQAARTLWFGGKRGEAIVVVSEQDTRSTVVMNLVSALDKQP